jgi:hypothetical protein
VWILAAAGRILGGGWCSAAKIHGFLLFSGGGRCPFGELNFGAPHWILGGWVVLQNMVCDHNYTALANEQGPGATVTATAPVEIQPESRNFQPGTSQNPREILARGG